MPRYAMFLFLVLILFLPAFGFAQGLGFEGEYSTKNPMYMAFGPDGGIYASEDGSFVNIRGAKGDLVKSLSKKDKNLKNFIKKPAGVAVYGDKLYVADASKGHIAVFTLEGNPVDVFGKKGSGPREFSSPGGICIYRGIIYVADSGNGRVQILGPNGVFMGQFGSDLEPDKGGLKKPVDLTVDSRGYIYVIDAGDSSMKVFNQKGEFIKKISSFKRPVSIAYAAGLVYVGDRGSYKILKFDESFNQVQSFGAKGEGPGRFLSLSSIAISPDGFVYVADTKRDNVQMFRDEDLSSGTSFISSEAAMPPPTFVKWESSITMPRKQELGKMAWDGKESMYVVDKKDRAVLVIRGGKQVRQIMLKKWNPVAVAIDSEGDIWVLDAKSNSVIKINERGKSDIREGCSGSREGCFSDPVDMVIGKDGTIYVADKGNSRIQLYNTDGMPIKIIGKGSLKSPEDLALSPSGELFVLDTKLKEVFQVTSDGLVESRFGGINAEEDLFEEPVSLTVTANEFLVLDAKTSMIKAFDRSGKLLRTFGSRGRERGDLLAPASIVAIDDITIAVSDMNNFRIETFKIAYTPGRVVGLGAEPDTRSARLRWDKNPESYVDSYIVYRAEPGSDKYVEVGKSNDPVYVDDAGLEPDVAYSYRVAAVARDGNEGIASESASVIPEKYTCTAPSEISVEPMEWSVTLSWPKAEGENIDYYIIYRANSEGPVEVGRSSEPTFSDVSLNPDHDYIYTISAVSTDGVQSDTTEITVRTLVATRPPIEIEVIDANEIFSNTYKYYEQNGLGTVRVRNNTRDNISKLKVSFTIKEFMDFPSEVVEDDLPPMSVRDLKLKAVFNNRILQITEDTPVQTEIAISYYLNGELKTFTKTHTMNIYDKHKMMWSVRERMVAFVTPKDPVVMDFARAIVTQYNDTNEPLLYASVLFDAMGTMGLTYMQDPSNPYQETSGQVHIVDYLQYPQETLKRKSGDCDDLVILYSSLLESLGIEVRVLDIPGHMFMMFSIGTVEDLGDDNNGGWFVVQDGSVWVPFEVTLVGKSFMKAWEKGSATYYEYKEQDKLGVMGIRGSWAIYKPATLQAIEWRPKAITRKQIETKFNDEFIEIRRIALKIKGKKHVRVLRQDPANFDAHIQLGIIFAVNGDTAEAVKHFDKAIELAPDNASALVNRGNVYMMENKYKEAADLFQRAADIESDDAIIWVSLARARMRLKDSEGAVEAFNKAAELDSSIPRRFRSMALKLRGPI